jgi:hypothetical protein
LTLFIEQQQEVHRQYSNDNNYNPHLLNFNLSPLISVKSKWSVADGRFVDPDTPPCDGRAATTTNPFTFY